MKKLLAVFCGTILAFTAVQSEVRADDDFGDQVQNFIDRAKDKVDNTIDKLKAYWNSPEVQAKIAEIKAEHKAHLKETLAKISDKLKVFRKDISPLVEAQLQLKFMELHAKMVDNLKIFKKQAAAAYEEELDKYISKLPPEVADRIREIRASENYQEKRAELLKKIEGKLVEVVHSTADDFREKLKDFINDRLDDLEVKIDKKIASL